MTENDQKKRTMRSIHRLDTEHKDFILLVFCGFIVFLATYALVVKTMLGGETDYGSHTRFAINFANGNGILTYPIWHCLVIFATMLTIPNEYAAALVSAALNTACYVLVCKHYVGEGNPENNYGALLACSLMFIGPFWIPWGAGIYGSINQWHNPTQTCVRPFAVVCLMLLFPILEDIKDEKQAEGNRYLEFAGGLILSVLAKPSFVQTLIPGLGIYILADCIRRKKKLREYYPLILSFVPCVLMMTVQFAIIFFSDAGGGGGIEIAPFDVASHGGTNVLLGTLLPLLFPLLLASGDNRRKKSSENNQSEAI